MPEVRTDRVKYVRLEDGGLRYVIVDYVNGEATFSEQEPAEVRWFDFKPSPVDVAVAKRLLAFDRKPDSWAARVLVVSTKAAVIAGILPDGELVTVLVPPVSLEEVGLTGSDRHSNQQICDSTLIAATVQSPAPETEKLVCAA